MHKNPNTKNINVNGENPKSEKYPLLFEVYAVYRKDNNNQNISKIINWLEIGENQ